MIITIDSNSFGKDSIAMIIERKKRNITQPQDIVLYSEVWATPTMRAEPPAMVEFIEKAETILKVKYDIEVTHVRQKYSYEEQLYTKKIRGKNIGKIYGVPFCKSNWCTSVLKTTPLAKFTNNLKKQGNELIVNIGYTYDEPERYKRLKENQRAPLVDFEITEAMAYKICKDEGLLSPIYRDASMRGGCWFCHNQRKSELKELMLNYPDRWELLKKWEKDTMQEYDSYQYGCFGSKTLNEYELRWKRENKWNQLTLF